MKLIKQTVLTYQAGRTEKVFEVDLCEVGEGRWVVNYRYGRRGAMLKDGTRTLAAVPEAEALREFDKLVMSKMLAGYIAGQAPEGAPPPVAPPVARPVEAPAPQTTRSAPRRAAPLDSNPQRQAVLARLAKGDVPSVARPEAPPQERHRLFSRRPRRGQAPARRPVSKAWPLDRAIWRAGEMRIASAAPLLANLVGTGTPMRDYAIAWALGRIASPSAVPTLRSLRSKPHASASLQRTTTASLLLCLQGYERNALLDELAATLPHGLRQALTESPAEVTAQLRRHLDDYQARDTQPWAALEALYLMNTPLTRPAVIDAVASMPLQPPAFRLLRGIFKVAELRGDGQVFGLVAYRFEKTNAMFKVGYGGSARVPAASGRGKTYMRKEQLRAMLGSISSTAAYSSRTRWYLRQRVWRALRRLGGLGDDGYVAMAVGVLQPFTDQDAMEVRTTRRWVKSKRQTIHFDRFGAYWALNHILYLNSPRYERGGFSWSTKGGWRPGGAEPVIREEAYPQLWDRQPAGLLHLIHESRCLLVQSFAVRALRSLRDFCATLPVDAVVMILGVPYEVTARFGFELAQFRLLPGVTPPVMRDLALAVGTCCVEELRREGFRWIDQSPSMFLQDGALLAGMVACPYEDARQFIQGLLRRHTLPPEVSRALVGSLMSHLMACQEEERAEALASVLKETFSSYLVGLGDEVLLDLVRHRLAAIQSLGAHLLLARGRGCSPSQAMLQALMESEHDFIKPLGVAVLGLLSDVALLEREDLLWLMTTNKDPELRLAIRPAVRRLSEANAEFGNRFLQKLMASLLRRRLAEGVPGHVVAVVREDFGRYLDRVPTDIVWRLLRCQDTAAQELGGVMLPGHLDPRHVEVDQVVELANHAVLSVRQAAWTMAERIIPRIKNDMASAVRLLDLDWEDSRAFACRLFEERFVKEDFTPTVLVSICDSVRPETQRFGRKLIAQHFDEAHGDEYLMKLSEHPSSDVQLFATNYLERYATANPERLAELAPYFTRVLCAVNRGRAARKRTQAFLRAEALRLESSARVVAAILERHSATIAVEDRAAAIETLAMIARTWPEVPVALRVRPVEVRG